MRREVRTDIRKLGRTVEQVTAVHDMNLVAIWVSKVSAVVPNSIAGTFSRWSFVSASCLNSCQVRSVYRFDCGCQKSDHASVSYGCHSTIERHIDVEARQDALWRNPTCRWWATVWSDMPSP